MKVLLVTNKVKTYALGFQNILNPMLSLGHEVVWAADFSKFNGDKSIIPCKTFQICIDSNPAKPCNYVAFKEICRIIKEENIEAIQCNTPIGGLLGRLAGKNQRVPLVIYAAHGFLFFKGAPLINRTVYKWEEMWLARYTAAIITINKEDFEASKKLKLRNNGKRFMIHGAGIESGKIINANRV